MNNITFNILVMVAGMIGGQLNKAIRRYGVPCLAMMREVFNWSRHQENEKAQCKFLIFGILIPILSMGYGVNSWLGKKLKKEWLIRLAYATILSIPFAIWLSLWGAFGFRYIVCLAVLIGAFQIRAGRLFSIRGFDFLIEDMIRYFTIGRLIIYVT